MEETAQPSEKINDNVDIHPGSPHMESVSTSFGIRALLFLTSEQPKIEVGRSPNSTPVCQYSDLIQIAGFAEKTSVDDGCIAKVSTSLKFLYLPFTSLALSHI
jgi:hypothetical protein